VGVSALVRPPASEEGSLPLERVGMAGVEAVPAEPVQHERPLFFGEGQLNYRCPHCERLVCRGIAPGDLAGLFIRCRCGAVGRVPVQP